MVASSTRSKPLPTAPQLDFAVWIVGVGIFGIQVKGGKYLIIDGQWFLITDRGRSLRESPVPGTWDAAMAIRDVVQEQLHQSIFVIPVLAMPNMEPNEDIEALAGSRNVAMHWGDPSTSSSTTWCELASDRKVYITPTPASIAAPGAAGRARAGATAPGSGRTGSLAAAPHPRRAPAHPHPPGPVATAGDAGLAPSSPRWTWSRTAARRTRGEEIFKADQGSQFTSEALASMLLAQGVQVSMDGRGRCMDNVFVERLWRSIKYEEVYLKAYQNGTEARKRIGAYLAFYNQERPHQALGYRSPGQVFHAVSPQRCLLELPRALPSDEGLRDTPAVDSLILASPLS